MDSTNRRSTAQGGEPAVDPGDWRASLQPEARQKIVNRLMETLKRYLPRSGEDDIERRKKVATQIEEQIYTSATSQPDYFKKLPLRPMESNSQNATPNSVPPNSIGNNNRPANPRDMKRFYKPKQKNIESSSGSTSEKGTAAQKKCRVSDEFTLSDIIIDPGLRKPIEDYAVEIRDQMRRKYILNGPCRPIGHNFPSKKQGKDSRRFLETWFNKYEWLEYSVEKDAAFCFYCYLFKQSGDRFGINVFTTTGFNNWKKAVQIFNEHVGGVNSDHNNAMRCYQAFRNQGQNVSHMLSAYSKEQDITYRAHLTAVLDVVRFLLLQGLIFRGHDESSSSSNRGNFLEMLNWYEKKVEKVENVGSVINENAHKNNQMTSLQIQKDLVRACAEETRQVIIAELGDRNFSVLLDESRDNSVKEQMTVILRFVNKEGKIIERFLCVEHINDTTTTSLKAALDTMFARHNLSISKLRGQGYNGASNMRGQFNELNALILNENPHAFYVHCFAHQLQLVVVSVAENIPLIADFFNYISIIVNIVGASCKRKDALLQKQHEMIVEKLEKTEIFSGRGQHQQTALSRFGDTRWGSHHTTLIRLYVMWESVLEVLENVLYDGINLQQKGSAYGLIQKMESFDFVFILHVMMKVLGVTNELSIFLQQKDQNIVSAMSLIVTVKELLQELRDNGWDALLEEVNSFCGAMSILVPNMEDCVPIRSRSRRAGQSVTYRHHYHVEIYIAVIDLISTEIDSRFSEISTELLRCIACLDPKDSFAKFDRDMLLRLAEIYSADFSVYDCIILKQQLDTYIRHVRHESDFLSCQDLASVAEKMVATQRHVMFPLVYRLIELALILPVAMASVERFSSTMDILKTDLRNKIGDKWFDDVMICYIERDIFKEIEDEKILQHFQNMQNRGAQLSRTSS